MRKHRPTVCDIEEIIKFCEVHNMTYADFQKKETLSSLPSIHASYIDWFKRNQDKLWEEEETRRLIEENRRVREKRRM